MYKHILIPTDGSELSRKAIEDGIALARGLKARVTGVHILPTRIGMVYGELAWVDESRDMEIRQKASGYLDEMEEAAKRAGVEFERVLQSNDVVWRGIVDVAREKGCDLIVMASHGRRGAQALVLGSETQRVLIHADVPVLVHRERARRSS